MLIGPKWRENADWWGSGKARITQERKNLGLYKCLKESGEKSPQRRVKHHNRAKIAYAVQIHSAFMVR
jgi:hypothetical protein